jgi:hypothetical protein
MKSVLKNNPEIYFVSPRRGSDWGDWKFRPGAYYDTTTGSKHPFWKEVVDLPQPSKDIEQLRKDMIRWGYCKVADMCLSRDGVRGRTGDGLHIYS